MDVSIYQKLAARTIPEKLPYRQKIFHSIFGMASEIGEIQGIYQKLYQGHIIEPEHLQKELGDLMWFIAEYCTANGWKLSDILEMNIEKLKKRYPDGFDEEKSLHRDKNDI